MFNLVVLTGRLTADPELKTTPNGISVTSFSIAVSRRYRAGEEAQADFINIVCWRQTAEFVSKYFKKGSMIGIEGSIQTRRYVDKNGNNRTAFEVVANNVQFVESKRDGVAAPGADEPASFSNVDANDFTEIGAADEDLPF
ncbi:MAG: single-stranded DNA-binding protein [Clostridia bacterium]|nr:single-stranded DNA-binding protein [Clostridia bacterium]